MCREPDPTDEKYCAALHRSHTRHAHFDRTAKKDVLDKFSVKHYAGSVQYTVKGWISRNNDRVPEGFQVSDSCAVLLQTESSKVYIVAELAARRSTQY
jgi:myosin heavy subunit